MPRKKINVTPEIESILPPKLTTRKSPKAKAAAAEQEPSTTARAKAPLRTKKQAVASQHLQENRPADKAVTKQLVQPEEPKVKKSRSRKEPVSKAKTPSVTEPDIDLPVAVWRSSSGRSTESSKVAKTAPEPQEEKKAPRKAVSRRRKELRDVEITAAAALELVWRTPQGPRRDSETAHEAPVERRGRRGRRGAKLETAPPSPVDAESASTLTQTRERISIPADAPQVVMRTGVPTLVRDGVVYPPISFFGSAQEEANAKLVFDQVNLAKQRGIHLFSHMIEMEVAPAKVDDAVSFAGYLLQRTVDIDPEAQVLFRLVFSAPRGWEEKYPHSVIDSPTGGLLEPSLCDDNFWEVAEDCLAAFIAKLRLIDDSGHVMGIHLERGEWFFADGWGYDTSIAAREKFQRWSRIRYRDDVVSLRAAWFDGSVRFDTIAIPSYSSEVPTGEEFVRTGRKARRWVDYNLFISDATVERITKLAHRAKKTSEGRYLVGVSYGYSFEWSHPSNGHLSLGKLLRTPEVDFIAGPPSYRNREPGGSAPFPGPVDSFSINGKLYISEEDFKTPISGKSEPDDFNPLMRTPQALESVHWRGIGASLAHLSGVSWMDLWGNGWLDTPGIWDRGKQAQQALVYRMNAPVTPTDAAVFIDERSLAYLVDQHAFTLLVQNVREAMLRSGLSVGFYLLSDLAHRESFPESKLYVFMNAWDIRPEVRSAIKSRLQRDGKVLFWLYAAGLFDGGRDSLERVREVTGIALKPQPFASKPGTAMLNRRHPLCEALPDAILAAGSPLEPSYFAIPEDGVVLGEYIQTGLPSFVMRQIALGDRERSASAHESWTSVFFGEPIVTPSLFRALGNMAGAHVWNYQDDLLHVRAPFLTIHCKDAGPRTITLPDKWSAYNLQSHEWIGEDTTHVRFTASEGSTHLFLVGPRVEIESILQTDPETVLKIGELPTRSDDTVHPDSILLDVPIMKLDEWMEESPGEESVEDLLLKPSLLEVEEIQASHAPSSARGRPRSRGRRRGGTEETAQSRREGVDREVFEELGMNVVFRKRE